MRQVLLFALVMLALAAMLIGLPAQMLPVADLPTLSYVTTAHQLGVVGYRDPFGAISPDGTRLAYAEGRFIRVVPIGGGVPVTLAPGDGQIRHLTWTNNSMIAAEDITPSGRWWLYQIGKEGRGRLWDLKSNNELRQLTCDGNGRGCAALRFTSNGAELVHLSGDIEGSTRIEGRPSWPAFGPNGGVACIVNARLTLPCGAAPLTLDVDRDVYGPIAFSRDGNTVYFSSPNAAGMVELWSADVTTRRARRLSNVSRDAYAPSVSSDGTVVFKVQSYRTHLADIALDGGVTRQLTTFQSETLAAPPRSDDGPAQPAPQAASQPSSRDKPGHVTRFARIGVFAADSEVMDVNAPRRGEQAVRYGGLFEIEQHWQSQGFHAGDVLYSLSLGPGDEAKVAVLDGRWRRKPDNRDRPVQIVAKMIAAPSVGDGLDAVPLEPFVVSELQAAATETGHYLAHRTARAADALRRRPLGVTELEGEAPAGASLRTVRNMRADGVLTYHFVEPVERFRVVTRTPRLRPAILVPFKLPNIATADIVRRFGHALRRALLDRGLLPDLDRLIAGTADRDSTGLLFAHMDTHLSYYSATIIAAGDPLERAQALAKVKDGAGRPVTEVIENLVVGRVGNYVAFPLRSLDYAPPEWRAQLTSEAARLLRASEETSLTLPIPGVWLRVQLSAAVPEVEIGMGESEREGEEPTRRRGRR